MNTLSHALLLRGLQSHNPGVRSRSVKAIQLVLEQGEQRSLYGVFGRDAFPLLAHIASKDVAYPQLRVKAAGVLAHTASGMQLHTHALIAVGAIQVLALGTSSPHQPADASATVEAALWFLANIGGYGTFKAMLDLVREIGVIDAFHAGLRSSDVDAVRFALEGLERTLDLLYELGEGSIVERQKASLLEAVRPLVDHHELQTLARSVYRVLGGDLPEEKEEEEEEEELEV